MILYEASKRGLMPDERFGFRPRHRTSLNLARLIEIIARNFGEKRLTGAVYLDVAKAFDNVWIYGFLYKLTFLNFPSYLAHKSNHTSGVELSVKPSPLDMRAGWYRVHYSPLSPSDCMAKKFHSMLAMNAMIFVNWSRFSHLNVAAKM